MVTVRSKLTVARLLKGNHANFVGVKIEEEEYLRIHRPVAARFSAVWKSALTDRDCRVVTVTLPSKLPAANVGPTSASTQATSSDAPPAALPAPQPAPKSSMSIPPSMNKLALKFVVQWMEQGGADPQGKNAMPYPKTRPGLELLLALAEMLQVAELIDRVKLDLGEVPAPAPIRCSTCKKVE